MKKSIYLLMTFAAAFFSSCEPMEDIHNEVDAALEAEPNTGIIEISLEEADYTTASDEGGLGLDDPYFTSFEQANDSLPKFLDYHYPVLGDKSIATVTAEVAQSFEAGSTTVYEVTAEDYTEQGLSFGNFDKEFQIINFLGAKYPDAEDGAFLELTYKWYDGSSTSTVTNSFAKVEGSWVQVMILDGDDFDAMEEAYDNFDTRAEAIQKIPVYLSELMPYAMKGDTRTVLFDVYQGGRPTFLKTFTFDGDAWQGDFMSVLQFGHNGEEWEPDNTIVYTFTPEDYVTVGEALKEKYPDPAGNVAEYASFEIRSGYRNQWTEAMFVEAAAIILDQIHPDAEEGQKYAVNVTTYSGSYATKTVSVIKQDGVWVAL